MRSKPRKAIYLDQMAWIHLTDREELADLRRELSNAVARGELIIPVSSGNIIETTRSPERSRRAQLAATIKDLSRGVSIAPEFNLVPFELDRAIAKAFSKPIPPPPNVFGVGVNFAFGYLEVPEENFPGSEQELTIIKRILDSPEGMYALLVGPPFETNIDMSGNFIEGAQQFAKKAEIARQTIKPFSSQVRKRGYAAILAQILDDEIRQSLSKIDIDYAELLALGQNRLMSLFHDVPCLDVEIELGSQRNGFWNRPVDPNDYVDIANLCAAIPYCDAVITEGFWIDLAKRSGLDDKYSVHLSKDVRTLRNVI